MGISFHTRIITQHVFKFKNSKGHSLEQIWETPFEIQEFGLPRSLTGCSNLKIENMKYEIQNFELRTPTTESSKSEIRTPNSGKKLFSRSRAGPPAGPKRGLQMPDADSAHDPAGAGAVCADKCCAKRIKVYGRTMGSHPGRGRGPTL